MHTHLCIRHGVQTSITHVKLLTVLKVLTIVRTLKDFEAAKIFRNNEGGDEDKNKPEKQQHESRYC